VAKQKKLLEKFGAVDKRQIVGRMHHTRTGACPSKGRCFHGRTPRKSR
jgi:hypothetical protein